MVHRTLEVSSEWVPFWEGALLQGALPWTGALPLLLVGGGFPYSPKSPSEFMIYLLAQTSGSSLLPLLSPSRMSQSGFCFCGWAREIHRPKPKQWSYANPKTGKVRGNWQMPHWFQKLLHDSGSIRTCYQKKSALKGRSVDGKLAGCFVPAVYSHTKQSKCRPVTQ